MNCDCKEQGSRGQLAPWRGWGTLPGGQVIPKASFIKWIWYEMACRSCIIRNWTWRNEYDFAYTGSWSILVVVTGTRDCRNPFWAGSPFLATAYSPDPGLHFRGLCPGRRYHSHL